MSEQPIPPTDASQVEKKIEDRFGVLPNFFRLASHAPEITNNLWGFASFGYLDNPLPSLLKERLFVYLSQFCEVRYCISRHVGFLVGLGRPSGDRDCPPQTVEETVRLLRRTLPRGKALEPHIQFCQTTESLVELPETESFAEEAIFACATHVFLQTAEAERCLEALRQSLDPIIFQHLLVFLAFVRTAHFWTKVHPELQRESDIDELLSVHEALAQCVMHDPTDDDGETTQVLLDELVQLRKERDQAELLRVTLASIGDAVIATDLRGRITMLNTVAEKLTGWTRQDAAGKPLESVFQIVNEETRQPVENPATKALRDGVIVGLANHTILIAKDGSECGIDDSAAPIRSKDGEVVGSVLVFRDITARRQSERTQLEQSRLLRLAAEVGMALTIEGGDLRAMLQSSTESMVDNLDAAFARIWTLNEDENVLELQASAGMYTHIDGGHARVPVGQFKIGLIAHERKPHLTNSVVGDDRVPEQEWAKREGLVAFAGYPLIVEDRVVGVMGMFARKELTDVTLEAMSTVATEIALAIQNWRNRNAEQKALEEARESRELLQITLGSIGDAVISTDATGNVSYLNAIAESLTGWNSEEALGIPLSQVFRIINETTRQEVENPALRALREGVIVGLANHTILIARDGTETPIDDSAAPIRDASGDVAGSVLIFRDITQRKQAEEALRESEEKLRLLADTIPQLAWMARPDGHIFWYNSRWYEYTGTSPAEMEGWGWKSVHDPDVLPKVLERWQASISSGQPFDMVFPLKGADGEFRPFLTRINPLRDDQEEIRFWFGTSTDISEQKRVQEELRNVAAQLAEANRRKTEFIATLGHELRNPLAPIRTGLEAMKLISDDPDTITKILETMERQVHQMVRLIDDLLDISRITQGKMELRTCRVALADVVQSAIEATRPFIDEAGHKFTVNLPQRKIYLNADPNRLAQVISNLLNNATKYTPDGGHIALNVEEQDGNVTIVVKDDGLGIPADMVDNIFEMFTQVDRPLEKISSGLGIGLTLVKRLVEMHNGSIKVRSDGTNQGSEFHVQLPVIMESQPHSFEDQPRGSCPTKLRILVVDDNTAAANMLQLVVKMLGHEVQIAADGQEAVEVAAEFLPNVVLMDLGMPIMDGYEAARQIRKESWGSDMLLVALTGWGQDEDRQQSQQAGFDHHLIKPAEPAALQELFANYRPQ